MKIEKLSLNELYDRFKSAYGTQGWWPLYSIKKEKSVYEGRLPRRSVDRFEIAAGAILTQSVAWTNVEKALSSLKNRGMLRPEVILSASHDEVASLIRPVGYFNQKTIKLKDLAAWFLDRGVKTSSLKKISPGDFRNELLAIKGVGPETADSILLYAYDVKSFVVDAYTKRILSRIGLIRENAEYEVVRQLFHRNFKGEKEEYRQYHAFFVVHGKEYCRKNPLCESCFLNNQCVFAQNTGRL